MAKSSNTVLLQEPMPLTAHTINTILTRHHHHQHHHHQQSASSKSTTTTTTTTSSSSNSTPSKIAWIETHQMAKDIENSTRKRTSALAILTIQGAGIYIYDVSGSGWHRRQLHGFGVPFHRSRTPVACIIAWNAAAMSLLQCLTQYSLCLRCSNVASVGLCGSPCVTRP